MSILKLKPACKDYLWGGHRLVDEYNVDYDGEILAEAWELSCHPDGPSMIMNGPYEGKSLREYLDIVGMEALGTHCRRFRETALTRANRSGNISTLWVWKPWARTAGDSANSPS